MNLPIGTDIYYTGDMANQPGRGTVVHIIPPSRWADRQYQVLFTDGREMVISPCYLNPQPGRRFWLWEEWQAERTRTLEEAQHHYKHVLRQMAEVTP